MSKEINSYPKIYNLGHRAIRDLFKEPVIVQEKIDGSQISFMYNGDQLFARSKRAMLNFDACEKMFRLGMQNIEDRGSNLTVGWVYRGEYLQKPKHNVLEYDRVPKSHIILFDVMVGQEEYLSYSELEDEADRLGFEVVPTYLLDKDAKLNQLSEIMMKTSVLGGVPMEGVVVKNYNRFDQYTGKVLMGKYVSEAFKEVHQKKKYKTSNKDIIQSIIENYTTEARWQKAVQAMREVGGLKESPEDIGQLIKYVQHDVKEECGAEIAKIVFQWAWKQVSRGITRGLPEWYKTKLLKKQFEEEI